MVIVPGGGAFADQVRLAQQHWQFDDKTAHSMAILAMQQMALLFKGLKGDFPLPGQSRTFKNSYAGKKSSSGRRILLNLMCRHSGILGYNIRQSRGMVGQGTFSHGAYPGKVANIDASLSLQQLAEQHIVDKGFCDFVRQATFKIQVINQQNL